MEDLAAQTKKVWEDNKLEFENSLDDWLQRLQEGEKIIRQKRKQFRQWNPLRFYVSVTKVKSSIFSLRFSGKDVAELFVKDEKVILRLKKGYIERNRKSFGATLENGDYKWKGKKAREFRAYFKNLALSEKGKVTEHGIESKFIQEMFKTTRKRKFGGTLSNIRPVTIGGCPLQFPVPISANTGQPKSKKGNIDILARHLGKNNKTRLSVWELKKPETYRHAASQAYIYAFTLLQILRHTKNASSWYKLFGYRSPIPRPLEIEAVVAITSDQENKFNREKIELKKNTSFKIGGDSIKLYAAYYIEESQSIVFERNPYRENQ